MLASYRRPAPWIWPTKPAWIWLKSRQTQIRPSARSWTMVSSNTKLRKKKLRRVRSKRSLKSKKVKITLRFRGREMAHQELGRQLLERVAEDTKETGRVENFPKMEGRQMVMLIGPLPK